MESISYAIICPLRFNIKSVYNIQVEKICFMKFDLIIEGRLLLYYIHHFIKH